MSRECATDAAISVNEQSFATSGMAYDVETPANLPDGWNQECEKIGQHGKDEAIALRVLNVFSIAGEFGERYWLYRLFVPENSGSNVFSWSSKPFLFFSLSLPSKLVLFDRTASLKRATSWTNCAN